METPKEQLDGMKGIFVASLKRNNKQIRDDRALAIAEDAELLFKREVEFPSKWFGFKLEDWRDDILLMIKKKQSQTQVSELKAIETKLNSLISEDKKKDIELQNLSKLLA